MSEGAGGQRGEKYLWQSQGREVSSRGSPGDEKGRV